IGHEQFLGVSRLRALEADNAPVGVAIAIFQKSVDIDAVRIVQAAVVFADAHNLVAGVGHQLGGVRTDVAETLDDHPRALAGHVEFLQGLVTNDHYAATGGLATAARAANVDGLAGNDSGHGLAHVHGVGVHHTCHGLFVGIHVRSGNVLFRAQEFDELGGVAPGEVFQLGKSQLLGINNDAALGAAERDVGHRTPPGHPTGQGPDFVPAYVGGVTDAAFGRTPRDGVLYAEAGKDLNGSVVHGHGDMNNDLAVGITEDLPQTFVQVEFLRSKIEASRLGFPGIQLLFQRYSFHLCS